MEIIQGPEIFENHVVWFDTKFYQFRDESFILNFDKIKKSSSKNKFGRLLIVEAKFHENQRSGVSLGFMQACPRDFGIITGNPSTPVPLSFSPAFNKSTTLTFSDAESRARELVYHTTNLGYFAEQFVKSLKDVNPKRIVLKPMEYGFAFSSKFEKMIFDTRYPNSEVPRKNVSEVFQGFSLGLTCNGDNDIYENKIR